MHALVNFTSVYKVYIRCIYKECEHVYGICVYVTLTCIHVYTLMSSLMVCSI